MLIAVTGATGFVGRYVVRHLVNAGHQVRCWHRSESDRAGFDDVENNVEWLVGQLGDVDATHALIQGVDAVIHAAVQWQGPRSRGSRTHGDPSVFIGANLTGSLQLFDAAHQAGIPRFVHVSTCAVHEVILEDRPLDEAHPLWPKTHYGAHKAALEKFVHSYGFGQGWPICAVRPTGVYGVAHPIEKSRWYDLVGKVVRGEDIESARGGKEVHAADVAKACEVLLKADEDAIRGQAFNCYDQYVSEQEVARLAKEMSGSKSEIADLNRGPKHQIETKKIRELGMSFGGEDLLRETVQELVKAHQR